MDDIYEIEARLVGLRARKRRWSLRLERVADTKGEAVERGACHANLRRVDEQITAAEGQLHAARIRATNAENRELKLEEQMAKHHETELSALRKLASDADVHARALAVAVKELHSKISTIRGANGGRGPSGELLSLNLRQAFEGAASGTVLLSWPRNAPRRKTFAQLIEGWSAMLGPREQPPPTSPPPPPPAARDKGFQRPLAGESRAGGPTLR